MSLRTRLLAVLLTGLILAGCESEPPAEPVGPGEPPTREATEPAPETPVPEAPAEAEEADLAAAVGHAPADACLVAAFADLDDLQSDFETLVGPKAEKMKIVENVTVSLPAGLDGGGPVVVILLGTEEPEWAGLFRVTDASAVQGEDAGAGIVRMQSRKGQDIFVLKLGSWAMVGDTVEAVKAVMRSEKKVQLGDAQRTALAERDVWLRVNVPSLVTLAQQSMKKMQEELARQTGQAAPPVQPAVKMMDWFVGVAKDVTGFEVVADVAPESIHLQADMALAEGSNLAAIANSGVAVEDYQAGLPRTDHLVLAAWAGLDWKKATPPMKALLKPLFDIFAEGKDEATRKALDDLWASYEQWAGVMGEQFGLVMELPEPGQGMFQITETFTVADPKKYREMIKEYWKTSKEAMDVMMAPLTGMPGMTNVPHASAEVVFKEQAETIEGVPVDLMRMQFTIEPPEGAPPQAAEQMKQQIQKMLEAMYGPNGMEFRTAVVDGRGVMATGGKDAMARAIKAVKGEATDLAAGPKVAGALDKVPEGQAVMLVSAANYVCMAMRLSDRMISEQAPPEVLAEAEKAGHGPVEPPPTTAFTRITGAGGEGRLTVTIDVPASDLRAAVGVAEKASGRLQFIVRKQHEMMQRQGGPGGGKAAPAPAPPK